MAPMRQRSGFTLGEVLTTVAILAALAAIIVPAALPSLIKGDGPAVRESIASVELALNTFVNDVRTYPGRPGHLLASTLPTGARQIYLSDDADTADAATSVQTYTTAMESRFRGPYLPDSLGDQIVLPFNYTIRLFRERRTTVAGTNADANDCVAYVNALVGLTSGTITAADAQRLEAYLGEDTTQATGGGSRGVVRYNPSAATFANSVVFCLRVPMRSSNFERT